MCCILPRRSIHICIIRMCIGIFLSGECMTRYKALFCAMIVTITGCGGGGGGGESSTDTKATVHSLFLLLTIHGL
jgi:hypothetical protein